MVWLRWGRTELIAVTNALGQVTRYQYDEAGNQTNQIDALNRTNAYAFDGMGRRISHMMPGGQVEGFAYDLASNLTNQTNFNGAVITNQYNSVNRLTNCSSINGYNVRFAYSPTGQRTSMVDASGTTTYGYDIRDRLLSKTNSWNSGPTVVLNYGYDANGNVTNIWATNGVNLAYSYDPLNRLTNVLANGNAAAAYGFDLAGNLQAMRYGNGVTNLCQYDSLNRLTNLTWNLNASSLANFSYLLGATGNRTNLTEKVNGTNLVYAWQYDPLYRLTNEFFNASSNLAYNYDPVGNRTNRNPAIAGVAGTVAGLTNQNFTFGTNDWLAGGASDQYDNNGNTTNSSVNYYKYDVMNHLTNMNGTVFMTYDGDGNRVSKTNAGTEIFFLLDDRNPSGYVQVLEEWTVASGTTNLSKVYNYGLSLINQRVPNTSTNYFVYDGHGSTRLLIDIGGNVANRFAYDAYGTLIASNGAPQTAYLYCGQQFDSTLGLYYNRARYLNPNTGRFWSMDTDEGDNEDPLSLHKYLYGGDNPVNNIDPSGHDFELGGMLAVMDFSGMLAQIGVPVTASAATARIEHKLTLYYNVNNSPNDFDATSVKNLLQSQLSANVFNNIKGGLKFEVQVHKGSYGGSLGWALNNTVYVNEVNYGWGNVAYNRYASNNQKGDVEINLNPMINLNKTSQLWANFFAHEGVWGNVAQKYDNNSNPDGEISSGTQTWNPFTALPDSRLTILKKCSLESN